MDFPAVQTLFRSTRSVRTDTKTGSDARPSRREPYWSKHSTGRHLGFRKLAVGGTWIARYRAKEGGQQFKAVGEQLPEFGFDLARLAAEGWLRDLDRGVTGQTNDGETATVESASSLPPLRWRSSGPGASSQLEANIQRERYP